jgi:uncharacterized membrane protein
VLRDYTPWGAEQEVIDEFPAFSFILGDMHPHLLALPFVLLALALALNLYLRPKSQISRFPLSTWEFLVYALCLGGLGFLNTWDWPIYLFIVAAAYALAALRNTQHAIRITLFFFALFLSGFLLYLPFWLGFRSQAGGALINLFNATRLPHFLVMFGPLLFIAVIFVADQARRAGVRWREVLRWTLTMTLFILGLLAIVVGLLALLVGLGLIPAHGPAAYLAAWLRGGPIPGLEDVPGARSLISHGLLSHLLDPWVAFGLVALLVTTALVHRQSFTIHHSPFAIRSFPLLLFAAGALLALSVEYVYLRDGFGTRMNTLFKYNPITTTTLLIKIPILAFHQNISLSNNLNNSIIKIQTRRINRETLNKVHIRNINFFNPKL